MPSINHGYQKQEDGSMTLIDLAVKAENAIMSDGSTAEENINNTNDTLNKMFKSLTTAVKNITQADTITLDSNITNQDFKYLIIYAKLNDILLETKVIPMINLSTSPAVVTYHIVDAAGATQKTLQYQIQISGTNKLAISNLYCHTIHATEEELTFQTLTTLGDDTYTITAIYASVK